MSTPDPRSPGAAELSAPAGHSSLRDALTRARQAGSDAVPELGPALRAFARELRDDGAPPEAALVALKRALFDAGFRSSPRPSSEAPAVVDTQTALRERIVSRLIEEYYRVD